MRVGLCIVILDLRVIQIDTLLGIETILADRGKAMILGFDDT